MVPPRKSTLISHRSIFGVIMQLWRFIGQSPVLFRIKPKLVDNFQSSLTISHLPRPQQPNNQQKCTLPVVWRSSWSFLKTMWTFFETIPPNCTMAWCLWVCVLVDRLLMASVNIWKSPAHLTKVWAHRQQKYHRLTYSFKLLQRQDREPPCNHKTIQTRRPHCRTVLSVAFRRLYE